MSCHYKTVQFFTPTSMHPHTLCTIKILKERNFWNKICIKKASSRERAKITRLFIWTCTCTSPKSLYLKWQLFNSVKWLCTPDLCHSKQRSGVRWTIYLLKPWSRSSEKQDAANGCSMWWIKAWNLQKWILVIFLS